ncbi:MAG: hypothetical protein AMXMBFR64_59740 [Myxococcales bacterium]
MDETVYIPLLEDHKELPAKEAVLTRFREAFFVRLERGSAAAHRSAAHPEAQEPVEDLAPDDVAAFSFLDEPVAEPSRDAAPETDLFGDFDDGTSEAPPSDDLDGPAGAGPAEESEPS